MNDDTVQDNTSDTVDSVVDTDVDAIEVVDEDNNLVAFPPMSVDIPGDLIALAERLKTDEKFNVKKAIVVCLDDNDMIGLFGYGHIHSAHQTLGILAQASNAVLNPARLGE